MTTAHQHLFPGPERTRLTRELKRAYDEGTCIQDLEARTGFSYGKVRRLLLEAGTVFRSRGGKS